MTSADLVSNGLPLAFSPAFIAPLIASPVSALDDGSARALLDIHGYVFLRGLLPRKQVLAVRENYFRQFPSSFVKDGDWRRAAISGEEPQGLPPYGTRGHPAYEFVRPTAFVEFAEHPLTA